MMIAVGRVVGDLGLLPDEEAAVCMMSRGCVAAALAGQAAHDMYAGGW